MIATTALLLLMLAKPVDPVESARKQFNNCIVEFTGAELDKSTAAGTFREAAQAACPEKKETYRAAIVKAERGYGSSMKDAEQFAGEEVQSVIDTYTRQYQDYADAKSKPMPEK